MGNPGPTVVVAGLEALGLAVVHRLVARAVEVRVLAAPADASRHHHEVERLGVHMIVGSYRSPGELLAAGLAEASVLILTADDDSENVDAALAARRLRPDLPIVVRIFDRTLGTFLEKVIGNVTPMSVSQESAPAFVEVARRVMRTEFSDELKAEGHRRPPVPVLANLRPDRIVMRALGVLGIIVLSTTVYFAHALNLNLLDAFYFVWSTVTTTGYGDITVRDSSPGAKVIDIALMISGTTTLTLVYGFVADSFVKWRLEAQEGRVRVRQRGHAVMVGAGNVGIRVAEEFSKAEMRIVVIERDGKSRNCAELSAQGHHVIVADAMVDETLELAAVEHAAVVLALTDSDAVNLHVAIALRKRTKAPVVMRLVSPELTPEVVEREEKAYAVSTIEVASERFVDNALRACGDGLES